MRRVTWLRAHVSGPVSEEAKIGLRRRPSVTPQKHTCSTSLIVDMPLSRSRGISEASRILCIGALGGGFLLRVFRSHGLTNFLTAILLSVDAPPDVTAHVQKFEPH
jgi:hypothetical protein